MAPLTHRVLLVDDEPALLSALRRVVERARPDAMVVYASDPASAIRQLETKSIRLVITDMCMDGDSEAGWRVVNAAQLAGVPVAVVSGATSSKDLTKLVESAVPLMEKKWMSNERLTELLERAFAA